MEVPLFGCEITTGAPVWREPREYYGHRCVGVPSSYHAQNTGGPVYSSRTAFARLRFDEEVPAFGPERLRQEPCRCRHWPGRASASRKDVVQPRAIGQCLDGQVLGYEEACEHSSRRASGRPWPENASLLQGKTVTIIHPTMGGRDEGVGLPKVRAIKVAG